MELNFKDKVVLITASTSGIGRGIAEVFLQEGAKVVVTGRNEEKKGKVISELKQKFDKDSVSSFLGDLTNEKVIRKCVEETIKTFGKIDILVTNLGSGKGSLEVNLPEADWEKMFNVNFNCARRIVQEVIPYMINNHSGSIVFISSIAGTEVIGAPMHYSVAKAALIAYSKNLSKKLSGNNIRVNTVCPGNIFFENGTWDNKLKENKEDVLKLLERNVPLKRLGTPEEIGNIVAFLSSEKASFITGACVVADGGQTSGIIG